MADSDKLSEKQKDVSETQVLETKKSPIKTGL
jgi:hypothetical protein